MDAYQTKLVDTTVLTNGTSVSLIRNEIERWYSEAFLTSDLDMKISPIAR